MKRISSTAAFSLGAACMYLFDRERGNRRRAMLRDKFISIAAHTDDVIYKTARDLDHRLLGLIATARSLFQPRPAPDAVLQARVRSRLGRVVSHPHAITVKASNGRITLSGPVLAHEADSLLYTVARVPGVSDVDNQLEIHKERRDIPSLQGGASPSRQQRLELTQTNWSPAVRFLVDAAGVGLISYGLRRRKTLGTLAGIAGFMLLLRATTNLEVKRLTGIGAGRRAIDIRKTINIQAPLEDVFAFWSRYENFPRFMPHVRSVRDLSGGRSRWTIAGPLGISFEWDAVVTEFIPNQVIAWKTEPGAAVENAGIIRFERNTNGTTRMDIRMSYNPVVGAIGHVVAMVLGSDPKHIMDDDLIRFKSLLEHGKATTAGRTITREEISV